MKLAVITINSPQDYDQWKEVDADYVSFVPAGIRLEDDYFARLVQVYEDRPLYRKISMVSPAVRQTDRTTFSWSITDKGYTEINERRSKEPYPVQISYVPGAVIKKTTLQKLEPLFLNDDMFDSVHLSLSIWRSGLRCFVEPMTDLAAEPTDMSQADMAPIVYSDLREMFKREYIS